MKGILIPIILFSLLSCKEKMEGCMKVEYNGTAGLQKKVYLIKSQNSVCTKSSFLINYADHNVIEFTVTDEEFSELYKITKSRYSSLKDKKYRGSSGYLTEILPSDKSLTKGHYETSHKKFITFIQELDTKTKTDLSEIKVNRRDFHFPAGASKD